MYEKALDMVKFLREHGPAPTENMYYTLIQAASDARRSDLCYQLLEDAKASSLIISGGTYLAVLRALAFQGDRAKCEQIFAEMSEKNFLTSKVYAMLLLTMKVIPLFRIFSDPNFIQDDVEASFKLFADMSSKGIAPDIFVFNTLINTVGKQGNLTTLRLLIKFIHSHHIQYDTSTYNSLINIYAKHGDFDHCFHLLSTMKTSHTPPDTITYQTLISNLVNSEEIELAKQYLAEMLYHNIKPDRALLQMIIARCFLVINFPAN